MVEEGQGGTAKAVAEPSRVCSMQLVEVDASEEAPKYVKAMQSGAAPAQSAWQSATVEDDE